MSEPPRPCERLCPKCGLWKHHARFASRRRPRRMPNEFVWHFNPLCRDCEQAERNAKRNTDRAHAVIWGRAIVAARRAGCAQDFVWTQLNYRALVPLFRATLTPEGLCLNCGHRMTGEPDLHIDHIEPPRARNDWARLHARNLRLVCASCNRSKGSRPFALWLDEQEGARLSNLTDQPREPAENGERSTSSQGELFA